MTAIANEVANAGIGVDIGINGLNELIKTNEVLEKIRYSAERMQNATVNLTTRVNGSQSVQKTLDNIRDISHSHTSNIDVHTSGVNTVNQLQDRLNQLKANHVDLHIDTSSLNKAQATLNKIKRSMNMDVHTNGGSGVSELNSQLGRTTDTVRRLGNTGHESLDKLGRGTETAKHQTIGLADAGNKIHGVFSGTFLGNAFSNAFSSLKSGLETGIKNGIKLAETGNEVKESWQHIGVGNGNSSAMVDQMDKLRDSAGIDEQSIQRMQKSFYTLTGSAPQARSLVNEVSAFGKASGESNQEITRMGTMLPRMLSTGKVRAQMFNRTFGQSGELVNALAKASGRSSTSFRQLVDSGKMTSQQLQQYMSKAAKGSSRAWAQYDKTFKGQMQSIKGSYTNAEESFGKPFVNSLTKSLNQTERSSTGLQKVQTSITKISHALGVKVGTFVGRAIGYIVKNQKAIFRSGTAIFQIVKLLASGAWKAVVTPLRLIGEAFGLVSNNSRKSKSGLTNVSNILSTIARHKTAVKALGATLMTAFAAYKYAKFVRTMQETIKTFKHLEIIQTIVKMVRAFRTADTVAAGAQNALNVAMKDNPVGMVVTVVGLLVTGLAALYNHCAPVRHAFNAMGHGILAVFKGIWGALKWVGRGVINLSKGVVRLGGAFIHHVGNGAKRAASASIHWFTHSHSLMARGYRAEFRLIGKIGNAEIKVGKRALGIAGKYYHKSTSWISKEWHKHVDGDTKTVHASARAHRKIDGYRSKSSRKFYGYISKNGRVYRKYHKDTTRISETTYKQREALRRRYYARYESNLRKYETNYRKYENKRSSLSRKYGKLRAMYSAKSLTLIETRFKKLRNLVVGYAKTMFKRTQYWFRRIGTGAGRQFRGIYRSVRKYLHMSNREAVKDFKTLARNSKRWLNGSVHKYVSALRYRFKRQRYYDRQLVRQAKKTATAMYHLPVGWITRETKDLIRNWRRQRSSFITHNKRMTHAEVSHISTMDEHLRRFRDRFEDMMSDLEDNIYKGWSKFWDQMHDRTGSGINSVEKPLNSGATNINSFVRAFGETSSPMHTMPMVSYATGTGFRRPINQMVQATLNDGHDSPETNNQETVIRPNGSVEFPKGQNVQELLEPGTEVLNATETKLMGQMAHFAPTVHLATGTGLFGGLFGQMSSWIKNALSGTNSGTSYSTIWNQAKGSGYHKLLHVLQAVLGHSEQILSGFMGNAPKGYNGVLGDIVQGIYGQTSNQIDQWWKVLMSLTNQSLNNGTSSSDILNYAEKNWMGVPYSYSGGSSQSSADCGGAVMSILRHFGINITHTDMEDSPAVRFVGTNQSDARPGDLVMFGKKYGAKSGYNSHVGIYAGNGQMWNECPPKSMMSPVSSGYGDGLWGYYRLRNAPSNNNNSLGNIKTNNSLGRFVKQQEAPMFKWIEKHLEPLLEPANPGGAGVARWRPYVEKALKANGFSGSDSQVAAWMRVIQRESNGDPHAVNNWDSNAAAGIPSKGLVQTIGPTFDSNAFPGHHDIFNGYDDLLAGIHYMAEKYGRGDSAFARVSGPEGYAKGGHFHAGQLMTVGEHGAELIKPDVSGEVIPHNETKRIMNNNSSHPVKVEQHNTFNVNGDASRSTIHEVDSHIDKANDTLADKLSRLMGFTEGGRVI